MVKLLTEPWGRKMHSDYYNMVFGEKLANILYEANSQFFYERNVIEEAVLYSVNSFLLKTLSMPSKLPAS